MSAPPGYTNTKMATMTPQQQQLLNQLISAIGGGAGKGADWLSKIAGGDESVFKELEAPAHAQFQQNLGQIGSRFSNIGARGTSSFNNAVAGEGAAMAERLQSQRLGIRTSAVESLLNQSQSLLGQKPFENVLTEDQDTDWGALIAQLLPALLKAFSG